MERYVLSGVLKPGDQMPSVRSLSVELSINPNTIQKAYSELDSRSLIYSVPGRGCFVADNAPALISLRKRGKLKLLDELAEELMLAGVEERELLQHIQTIYQKGKDETT